MNNISFCAKAPAFFHEDSLITKECIEKGKQAIEKAAEKIEHTPFDGLIEKAPETEAAKISEAFRAKNAPYEMPKKIASDAAVDGYNEFNVF